MKRSIEWDAWRAMKYRACSEQASICEAWVQSFAAFFGDIGPRTSQDQHRIARIDTKIGYIQGNVAWMGPDNCVICNGLGPFSAYESRRKRRRCRQCSAQRANQWSLANAERVAARVKSDKLSNPEKTRAWRKRQYDGNASKYVVNKRRSRYGLEQSDVDAMMAAQGSACAICRKPLGLTKGDIHIDHDHATKFVRGLLCHCCNIGLGMLGDTMVLLRAAIDYLDRARAAYALTTEGSEAAADR